MLSLVGPVLAKNLATIKQKDALFVIKQFVILSLLLRHLQLELEVTDVFRLGSVLFVTVRLSSKHLLQMVCPFTLHFFNALKPD